MKAVLLEKFGGSEHFKMGDLPDPQAQAGEVRIRVSCAAFNPVDYKMRLGAYGGDLPLILGADCSGVIDQVGPHVKGLAMGDEVVAMPFGPCSNGSYAELVCLPASFVAKKPKRLSFAESASFPLISLTAYRALIASDMLRKGDSLFIMGAAGGVGSFAVELARHAGASGIFTIARDEEGCHFLTSQLGLKRNHIVIYGHLNDEQLIEKMLECNGGRHFDVVCDLVGGDRKAVCLELARYSGRFTTTVPEKEGFDLPSWGRGSVLFAKNLSAHFTFVGAESFSSDPKAWNIYADQLPPIAELIDQGVLHAPAITVVGDLSVHTVQKAHRLLEEGKVKGKLVMNVPS
jgi:NADPH:quinone reductase